MTLRVNINRVAIALAAFSMLGASCSAAGAADVPGDQPVELLNPGFEEDEILGWVQTEPVKESGVANSGDRAVKITGEGGMIEQEVAVEPGAEYRLSGFIQGVGRIGVSAAGSSIAEREVAIAEESAPYEYREESLNFETGDSTSVVIYAAYANGQVRYDDISLVKLAGDPDPTDPDPTDPDPTVPDPTVPDPTDPDPTDPDPVEPGEPNPDDPTNPEGDTPANVVTVNPDVDPVTFTNPSRGLYTLTTICRHPVESYCDIDETQTPTHDYVWSDQSTDLVERRISTGKSLVLLLIDLRHETDTDTLPPELIELVDTALGELDASGTKAIVRVRYRPTDNPIWDDREPTPPRMLNHLEQLAVPINANRSAVAFVEAGFVGPWGEWHTSEYDNLQFSQQLLDAWTTAFPGGMVNVRRPELKHDAGLTESQLASVGYYNDCFLRDETHSGTYQGTPEEIAAQKNSVTSDSLVPIGGEECGITEDASYQAMITDSGGECSYGIEQLEAYGFSYLNDRLTGTHWRPAWEAASCWETLSGDGVLQRLGYRFRVLEVEHEPSVAAGSPTTFSFTVTNDGFGRTYSDQAVEVVLSQGGEVVLAEPVEGTDPRDWAPGEEIQFSSTVEIPDGLTGEYVLGLRLSDPHSPSPLHAIRFANTGWCADPLLAAESSGCLDGGAPGVHGLAVVAVGNG